MKLFIYFFLIISLSYNLSSQNNLVTKDIVTGLDTPWEILWGPDDYIWVSERYGRISRVNPLNGELKELIKISDVYEDGERGLLGMVLHPKFNQNPFLYTVYTYGSNNDNTRIRIVRFTYSDSKLINPLVLIDGIKGWWNHDGSRLWIDDEEKLWFTIGDAANAPNAQNLTNLNGKLCRMNLDGTIPSDNPFPNSYIWSYGHRNQQGMVFVNGKIFTSEHGANTNDELNLIQKGKNYGWPNVEGDCDTPSEKIFCENNNVVEPILALTPTSTLAVAGIDFYNSDHISDWKNSILVTSLKAATLIVAKLNITQDKIESSKNYFVNQFGRLRDLCISPSGKVYIATSNKDGRGNPKLNDDRIFEIDLNQSNVQDDIKTEIEIYPNPTNSKVDFKVSSSYANIMIFNDMGELVKKLTGMNNSSSWDLTDDKMLKCKSGIYYVRFETEFSTVVKQIAVIN